MHPQPAHNEMIVTDSEPGVGIFVVAYSLTAFSGWLMGLATGWVLWHHAIH